MSFKWSQCCDCPTPLSPLLCMYILTKASLGLLCQTFSNAPQAVAYLSKQLDSVIQGWPPCLKILGAATLLASEAQKLTRYQHITIASSHNLQDLMSFQSPLSPTIPLIAGTCLIHRQPFKHCCIEGLVSTGIFEGTKTFKP